MKLVYDVSSFYAGLYFWLYEETDCLFHCYNSRDHEYKYM